MSDSEATGGKRNQMILSPLVGIALAVVLAGIASAVAYLARPLIEAMTEAPARSGSGFAAWCGAIATAMPDIIFVSAACFVIGRLWRVRPTVVGVALLVTYAVLDVIFTMRTLGAEGGPATVWVNYCLLLALPLLAGALCLIYGTRLRRRAARAEQP